KLEVTGGNINVPNGGIYFDSGSDSGTSGIAASDTAGIYGEHDAGTETSRLVLSIQDNFNDSIVLRTYGCCGGAGSRDMVVVDNTKVSLAAPGGNVGIGTTAPFVTLHAISSASTGPLVLESYNTYDVFSVLPWAGVSYLGSGVYYKDGAWVHNSFNTYNALFGIQPNTGAVWYDSNNSSASWNVASGVTLWNTTGTWVGSSSRALKENFLNLNLDDILEKISQLGVTRWNFKSQDKTITHIGPVAEDFYKLFKTGQSEKQLPTIDEAGVALAGVKGLLVQAKAQLQQIDGLQQEIKELKKDNKELKSEMGELITRLSRLEAKIK
ncbi:MAG: tail fiber domain-containing protein, partial [Candidatus Omnitrophota bacterium]|nr:tail fiber domain-containing protein [Candidatus Omnitrophota bacterium]